MDLHDFLALAGVIVVAVIAFVAITRGLGRAIDWFAEPDRDTAMREPSGTGTKVP
jgi:hypothetical protein